MEVLALSLMIGILGLWFLEIHNMRLELKRVNKLNLAITQKRAVDTEFSRSIKEAFVKESLK